MARITILLAHEIEEAMQVQLLHELGHEVFSIGAYLRPSRPGQSGLRPALPQVPEVPHLIAAVEALSEGQPPGFDCLMEAKKNLPQAVVEWTDILVVHHLEHTWLVPQWDRLKDQMRVIWRTVGQSTHGNEWQMRPLFDEGMEIVRYSPLEANIPEFAGQSALIRFWMDPDEWTGWTGDDNIVTNVTQDLYRRSLDDKGELFPAGLQWTSWQFWEQATRDLPRKPAGPGSQTIGGTGALSLPDMQALLRSSRAYCYMGTQPASYTLGFIEALMTGIPVVSIGPQWHRRMEYSPLMFEAHELAPLWSDRPSEAAKMLERLLSDRAYAEDISAQGRQTAVETFGKAKVMEDWRQFLGAAVPVREAVAA